MLANRELFLLHQRNHAALEQIADTPRHRAENEDIEQQFRRSSEPAIPLADRVRMACSIGAVLMALMGADALFGDEPPERVAELVRGVVHDMFP